MNNLDVPWGDEDHLEAISQEDQDYINKQNLKEPMEPQEESWTSVDAYYKGFHIKKSWGKNVSRVILMTEIDDLIKAGFTPSWNQETNKAMSAPVVAPVTQNPGVATPAPLTQKVAPGSPQPIDDIVVYCKFCKGTTTYKEFTSKKGNFVKGYFCDNTSLKCLPYYVK